MANLASSRRRWLCSTSIACFVMGFCTMGVHRASSGIVYIELMTSNDVDREQASWPISVGAAVHALGGLAGGLLLQIFTFRQVAVSGVLACTSGFALCFLSTSMPVFVVGYGVLAGIGVGFVLVAIHSYLNTELMSHRATASGIFKTGPSLAVVILPFLIEWMVQNYALVGTMLLLSGLTLQSLVFNSLIRPCPKNVHSEIGKTVSKEQMPEDLAMCKSTSEDAKENVNPDKISHLLNKPHSKTGSQQNGSEVSITEAKDCVAQNSSTKGQSVLANKLSSNDSSTFVELAITPCSETQNDLPLVQVNPPERRIKTKLIFDRLLEVAANRMFHIITLAHLAYLFLLLTYNVIIMDFAMDKGMSRDKSVYLLSINAVAELVGRASFGWITDRGFLTIKQFLIICDLLLAAILFTFTFTWNHGLMFFLSCAYGAVNGTAFANIHALYADFFRPEVLSIAMGLGQGLSIVAFMARPPVIGLFRDVLGSYDYLFVVLAALPTLAALAWILEPGACDRIQTGFRSSPVGDTPKTKTNISSDARNG